MTTREAIDYLNKRHADNEEKDNGVERYGEYLEDLTTSLTHRMTHGPAPKLAKFKFELLDKFQDAIEQGNTEELSIVIPTFRAHFGQEELDSFYAYNSIT